MSPALPGGFFTTGPLGNQVHHEGGDIDLMTANTVKLRPEYSYEVSMEVHGFHTIRFMPYRFYFDDVTCTVRLVGQEDLVAVGGLHRHLSPQYWFRSKINPFARMLWKEAVMRLLSVPKRHQSGTFCFSFLGSILNTWASLVSQWWIHLPSRHKFNPWVGKIPWNRKWQPHSSILAWGIPWTEEPGRLRSMESQRVEWDRACAHIKV